jgi:fatty acid amide hydrolase
MESKIIDEYMLDVSRLLIKNCIPKKTKAFTTKYITKLLNVPNLESSSSNINSESIEDITALKLQELLFTSQTTYTTILNAYHRRKQLDKNSYNSLTWSMYEEPLKIAQNIDRSIKNTQDKETLRHEYPLAGFVISVKDSFYLKGSPCTSGMFINMDRVATRDPEIFSLLKRKGALLTSRGNIPQFLVSLESNNNLFGECLNPLDKTRTPGGSSGGDAANVLLGYANVGFGSDIAGSLRAPALHCGLYSLKPTNQRISNVAMSYFFDRRYGSDRFPNEISNSAPSQMFLKVVLGCMTRSVKDIERVMEVICNNKTLDNLCAPLPWNPAPVLRKRIGVFRCLSIMEPSKATSRAVDIAVQRLQNQGYSVVEMDLDPIFQECAKWAIICLNNTKYLTNIFNGTVDVREPLSRLHLKSQVLSHVPNFMLSLVGSFGKNTRIGKLLSYYAMAKSHTQADVFAAGNRLYRKILTMMNSAEIDAIVMPGYPTVAPQLYNSNLTHACYLLVFNFLKMPAGICPVTKVRADEQFYESVHKDPITKKLKEIMKGSEGMPLGVQIAGRSFQDEVVLKVMRDLENEFKDE